MKKQVFYISLIILAACKTHEDPSSCDALNCPPGHTCQDGTCICSEGYTGSNCEAQLPSQTITILKIVLENFPSTDNGMDWDIGSFPDIFIAGDPGTSVIDSEFDSNSIDNCIPSAEYVFDNLNWTFDANENVALGIYDQDGTATNEFMGSVFFLPQNYDLNFPQTITLYNDSLTFEIYVSWGV